LITKQPYIFSNGYKIRFNEIPPPGTKIGYIVPEWIDEKPVLKNSKKYMVVSFQTQL
jgi:sacsin